MNTLVFVLLALAVLLAVGALGYTVQLARQRHILGWLVAYLRGGWRGAPPAAGPRHLLFCFVDHYEPAWAGADTDVQNARVARWRRDYPKLCEGHRDADGRPPVHTFFFPEEEYRPEHLNSLVELCRLGLGEIEIHLHHENDTEANLRATLRRFTRTLVEQHDALPVDARSEQPLWSFIHGNWALDNCHPSGAGCGINNELIILREEGCYADFTYPCAPDPCQVRTINRIYYATDDPAKPKSHDIGERVRVGGKAVGDLLLVQGILGLNWRNRKFGLIPRIENSDVRAVSPPDPARIDDWVKCGIHVQGKPEWIFVKVHTHGTQERDMDTLLGAPMAKAFDHLEAKYNDGTNWKLHYVSAREAYNIIKAAEAGETGKPGAYRDFLIPRPGYGVRDTVAPA